MKNFTSNVAVALFLLMMFTANANAQFVISKVFYAGTKTIADNKNYSNSPEYIELHNNTATDQNIGGTYICLVESETTTGAYLAKDRESGYEVKLKQVFQIPDEEYMVPAYTSVVIAANPIDHTAAINGQDLSKAEFAFPGKTEGVAGIKYLELKYTYASTVKFFNIVNGGDASILIVKKANASKLPLEDESAWVFANGNDKGNKYVPFNAYYAMDAVEILKAKKNVDKYEIDATRKRFSDAQDAGYVQIPETESMLRDANVVYRKTALNMGDGKKYLLDTGDSSKDFAISNTIGTKQYEEENSGVIGSETITIPESGFLPFNAEKCFFTGKDLYIGYVSISSGKVSCNSKPGNTVIASNSPYLLIGAPGEHTIYYSEAPRSLASAGADAWIADGDTKYTDGVLTMTTKNRFPMKFVNEKGNPRFVSDPVESNKQKLNINIATEGRFYITHTIDTVSELKWEGITPEEVTGVEDGIVNVSTASNAVYSIQGVKMTGKTLAPGVYVKNGKAFVVK